MLKYKPVNLNKHKSEVLVVYCCDPRFQEAYHEVASHIGKYYDLLVVPGASKAIVENPTVIENIKMLHGLHHFNEIHIMDHVECGAFGKVTDEVADHSKYIRLAENKIKKTLPKLKIKSHLLGAKQELQLV